MIIGALLSLLYYVFNFLLGLLPTAGFSTSITDGIHNFFAAVYSYNGFFPIDTAFTLIGFSVTFWLIVFSWDFIKWLTHLIRGN